MSRKRSRAGPSPPGRRIGGTSWFAGTVVVALLAGGGALWWRWPGGTPPWPARPHVLLVTLDTTRADRLGSYGYADASTPHLDRLAAGGVRFARALSPAPLTLPAHASLMTGRNPYAHGVRNNGHFTLPDDVPTLAERFSDAGYDTAAFVSAFVLDRQFGLARGFAHYDDTLDPAPAAAASVTTELERRGDRTVRAALAWLTARPAAADVRPRFVWVHLYDPHDPYAAPEPFAGRMQNRPYDAEVAFVDAAVGELLAGAERAGLDPRRTLIVVAADHGESLGEHGESAHGLFVYEGAVRVPLLMAWAGALEPRVVQPPVRLIDVAPTIAAIAGIAGPAGADGRDLTALLRGDDGALAPAPAYAETLFPEFFMGWARLRAIDDGRWKYIDSPEPELYDVVADPKETTNRAVDEPATARELRRRLEETTRAADRSAASALSTEARQKLAALGYVSTPALRRDGPAAPAPARMVGLFERLARGNRALAAGRPSEAVDIARAVLREDAGNAFATLVLGRGLLALGDAGAAAALTNYLARVPTSADGHHWLALALLQRGDRARALAEEDAALAIDPRHAPAVALRAGLLFSAGKRDEGVAALRTAVQEQPANATLRVDYADLLADAGGAADAETEYRRVLAAYAGDLRARAGLGMLLAKIGRLDAAIVELTQVLDADPGHEEARVERAAAYARLGRAQDARADLERLTGPEVRPDIRRTAMRALRDLSSR